MRENCGVIYVATGENYRDLARASARSLRAVEPDLPMDLFSDAFAPEDAALFDVCHLIENPEPRSKLVCMQKTRFERTLFLDADTQVIAPLGDLFDLLERFEFAMAHDVRRASVLIAEGLEECTPRAFPQLNSGVLLYRKSEAMLGFFAEWYARFKAAGVSRDQIILKDMLWRTDLRFYVLPPEYNLRRVTELDAWEPLDAVPTILHSHRFMDHLHGKPRIWDKEVLLQEERAMLLKEWEDSGRPMTEADAGFARFAESLPEGLLPELRKTR